MRRWRWGRACRGTSPSSSPAGRWSAAPAVWSWCPPPPPGYTKPKALVGAFSVIVQPVVEPMEHYTALVRSHKTSAADCLYGKCRCSLYCSSFVSRNLLQSHIIGWENNQYYNLSEILRCHHIAQNQCTILQNPVSTIRSSAAVSSLDTSEWLTIRQISCFLSRRQW